MRILLQFPEGLKQDAMKYATKYEKEGHEVIVSAEPSYGACDLPIGEARLLKCDKIVHFGHTKFVDVDGIKIEYVIANADVDVKGVMEKAIEEIKGKNGQVAGELKAKKGRAINEIWENGYKRVGIITNASHLHQIGEIKEMLKAKGLEPVTAKGSLRCNNEGQILGCDVTALNAIRGKVDCIIYFGTGHFHALAPGAVENYNLPPVLWVDPYSREVKWIDDELKRMQKRRRAALAKAADAKVFGILVSTKAGQYALGIAERIKREIEGIDKGETGKKDNGEIASRKTKRKAVMIIGNTFDFTSLNNFMEIECFINTACPRMVDDQNKLRVPIINAGDTELIL
jgi:2-(3-amino-3-carboxypropyl)histidine synthase